MQAVGDSLFFGETADTGQYIFRGTGAATFSSSVTASKDGAGNLNTNTTGSQLILSRTAGGAAGSSATAATPTLEKTPIPQITGTQQATPGQQIASTLAQRSGKPIKAYVVSQDIQTQSALDRRTNRAATFSG